MVSTCLNYKPVKSIKTRQAYMMMLIRS